MTLVDRIKSIFRKKPPEKAVPVRKFPFEVKEDDVFIVSFPKSGNTWVRFLLGNYITENAVNFKNAHLIIPDMHFNPAGIAEIKFHPRLIKSHLAFQPEFKRAIYIVRDGREAAVSLFYYMRKMKEIAATITLSEFLENYFFPGKTAFGFWDKHVLSWIDQPDKSKVLLIRYEDMIRDTAHELRRMVEFCGWPVDEAKIASAVAHSSFDSMKKDEEKDPELIAKLGKSSIDTGYGFVRKGDTDSWRQELTAAEQEKFSRLFGKILVRLGYPES